jgi:hypothetical protein
MCQVFSISKMCRQSNISKRIFTQKLEVENVVVEN